MCRTPRPPGAGRSHVCGALPAPVMTAGRTRESGPSTRCNPRCGPLTGVRVRRSRRSADQVVEFPVSDPVEERRDFLSREPEHDAVVTRVAQKYLPAVGTDLDTGAVRDAVQGLLPARAIVTHPSSPSRVKALLRCRTPSWPAACHPAAEDHHAPWPGAHRRGSGMRDQMVELAPLRPVDERCHLLLRERERCGAGVLGVAE